MYILTEGEKHTRALKEKQNTGNICYLAPQAYVISLAQRNYYKNSKKKRKTKRYQSVKERGKS